MAFVDNLEENRLCFIDAEVFQWELPRNQCCKAFDHEFTDLYWISLDSKVGRRVRLAELQCHRCDSLFRLLNVDFQPETCISQYV